jgi:hypothetical protein
MQLFTVAPSTTLSEGQIQRNFQKLSFKFSGSKAGATSAGAQLKTDAGGNVYHTEKSFTKFGRKNSFPRA